MNSLIVILMDESGSMASKKNDVIGGFNEFLAEQKGLTTDSANAIFIKFNSHVKIVNESIPIGQIQELTKASFKPAGSTALYDAIYDGVQLAEKIERDFDRVLCVIMTDGEENMSRKITNFGIRELIKKKENEGKWTFLYIGENPERWANDTGSHMGNVAQYDHSRPASNYVSISKGVTRYRSSRGAQHTCLLSSAPDATSEVVQGDPPPPYTFE